MPAASRQVDDLAAISGLVRIARLLERTLGDLSLSQFRVLAAVAAGDERASRIAQRLALGKPAISATVDSLRQRGLLDRLTIDGDQRAAALRLTEDGQDALESAQRAMQDRLHAVVTGTPNPPDVLRCLSWLDAAVDAHVIESVVEARA